MMQSRVAEPEFGQVPEQVADWQVPNVQMIVRGESVTLHEALRNKRGIIFGVPGAFTPVCTQKHIRGFRDCLPYLKQAVEYVACVAVNDPYVLKAWAKEVGVPKDIVMISDWEAKFTKALGLELDASSFHMGLRCRRFCILVTEGTIVWFGLENDAFVEKVAFILNHLGLLSDSALQSINGICAQIDESSIANGAVTNEPTREHGCARTLFPERMEAVPEEKLKHGSHQQQYNNSKSPNKYGKGQVAEGHYWDDAHAADDGEMSPVEEEADECTDELGTEEDHSAMDDYCDRPSVASDDGRMKGKAAAIHAEEDDDEELSSLDEINTPYR